jgi:valyl-tRNA synthetase
LDKAKFELASVYNPKTVEDKWYSQWESKGLFHGKVNKDKKPYTIVIPPPNITGSLTMGHVLNNTIQDIYIRYKRMSGYEACWIPGTDHAGIATQQVVERDLKSQGKQRLEIGREKFNEELWNWKEQYGNKITKQLRKIGISCDWERERFTMDEGLSNAVKEVFVKLYEKNLVYRGKYIVNWCPVNLTAISDDEVINTEQHGHLWYLKYEFADFPGEYAVVATTRPETMLGDTAIAVNPKDERYQKYIGKFAILPIVNRKIPIVADDFVDPAFGTGMVKVTPAHDPNDFEMGTRHNLEKIIVMDIHAKMNENAPEKYRGLDRYECRKVLVEDLDKIGALHKVEDYTNSIGRCYRCNTVIEPYLSDQWFVKMKPLAEKALKVVVDGDIKFYPDRWTKVYQHWMENIRDWCISRQLWWGHRIPVYYCKDCDNIMVAKEEPKMCTKCRSINIYQDEDVLDTWFSSWLWPFSTLNWPQEKDNKDLEYFYPTDLLVTGPDIIFFWVARMIMAGLEFKNEIPFKDVYFTSIIRDTQGRKMSKSLGNSPDPLDVINDYGADALRFTIIFLAPLGQDVKFSSEECEIGRNFANKIWNAGRFLLMHKNQLDHKTDITEIYKELDLSDKWILSSFNRTIKNIEKTLGEFNINEASKLIYSFFWHDFCDWYIEIIKQRINNSSNREEKCRILSRAFFIYEQSLKMVHPFMPFITEEIWQNLDERPIDSSISVADYPLCDESLFDEKSETEMIYIQKVVESVREIRSQMKIAPSKQIELHIKCQKETSVKLINENLPFLSQLTKANKIEIGIEIEKPEGASSSVVMGDEIFVPLKDLIDVDKEKERIQKEISRVGNMVKSLTAKLNNENFLSKAPKDVVDNEKDKLANFELMLRKLQENFDNL